MKKKIAKSYSPEYRRKMAKKYYKLHKQDPTFRNKDGLLVRFTLCYLKSFEQVNAFPIYMRQKLHRYNYEMQPGSYTIPEIYLSSNQDMTDFCAQITGDGEWLISAGFPHKQSRRVNWKPLIRYKAYTSTEGDIKTHITQIWAQRLRRYWFRKDAKQI